MSLKKHKIEKIMNMRSFDYSTLRPSYLYYIGMHMANTHINALNKNFKVYKFLLIFVIRCFIKLIDKNGSIQESPHKTIAMKYQNSFKL